MDGVTGKKDDTNVHHYAGAHSMKSKGEQEFPDDRRVIAAANEEFHGAVSAVRGTAPAQSGWDPYEVWLTRVKAAALGKRERQRDPLGQSQT
jgi:hypothetical protein